MKTVVKIFSIALATGIIELLHRIVKEQSDLRLEIEKLKLQNESLRLNMLFYKQQEETLKAFNREWELEL